MTDPVIDLKQELRAARLDAIRDSFGGESTYRFLKERNPQIDIILNAGIMAGIARARDD
jgi:hypothetical protein